jgi:hypothetical protein
LILNELADAVAIGKTMVSAHQEPKQRPRRVRSKRPILARADEAQSETVTDAEKTPTTKETAATTTEPMQESKTEQQEPKQSTS